MGESTLLKITEYNVNLKCSQEANIFRRLLSYKDITLALDYILH